MGLFGALNTAVSGLRAQSYALDNISGNIANSQTIGYKRTDTRFEELVADAAARQQVAGSVRASSSATNTVQGDVQAASISTYMAINGRGFFMVQTPNGFVDGRPTFDTYPLYTRRGDFEINSDGYLVNGGGYYLMGMPLDATTGNAQGSSPEILRFQMQMLPATQTNLITYHLNLPASPITGDFDPNVPHSELLDDTAYSASPLGTGAVVGSDVPQFLKESISGGAVTAYDTLGAPLDVQFRWAKIDSVANGGSDTWNLFYQVDGQATGADVAWQNVGTDYVFSPAGLDPAIPSIDIANLTIKGVDLGTVKLMHDASVTQFSDPNGAGKINHLTQNGHPAGELTGISVSDQGNIVGLFSNGQTVDLASIALADFNNPNGLQRLDGGAFAATTDSGPAILGAEGNVTGGPIEASNTDIADEFAKLIVTQQAYSANARIITTAQQMSEETMNMLR